MTSRVLLLLGLLGLILLMLAGCDWISRRVAEWMYRTSIISWILSFGPNYMFHFVVATVQSVLLNWAFPSLLYAVLHIKVQRMTLTGPIYSTSKLELTFQSFEYSSQGICIQISVLCIEMDIFPISSESPCIYICKPKVTINFAKGTHNRTKNGLSTNDPETTAPTHLETFPNYLQRALLQYFLRRVDFSFTNGIVQVIDKSRQFQLNVNLNFEKIWYDKFNESKLLIIGLWASIDLVDAFRKANFGCESCKITFSNFRKRSQPYSNKLLNILVNGQTQARPREGEAFRVPSLTVKQDS
uniref:Uncharacterized protein n=1 Tax=Anopheles funestus TaxID=62324 RepID=A0A4Y0BE23_ANOFN